MVCTLDGDIYAYIILYLLIIIVDVTKTRETLANFFVIRNTWRVQYNETTNKKYKGTTKHIDSEINLKHNQ
jgi:hypothetical protein